jgi:hypothetical protein
LPAPRERAHGPDLGAEKSRASGEAAISAPTTSSDDPYIGEESTTRPPAARNARRISPRVRRAADSAPPTSNVSHVPSPTTGIASPLAGIFRVVAAATGWGAWQRRRGGERRREEPQGLPPVHASPPSFPD